MQQECVRTDNENAASRRTGEARAVALGAFLRRLARGRCGWTPMRSTPSPWPTQVRKTGALEQRDSGASTVVADLVMRPPGGGHASHWHLAACQQGTEPSFVAPVQGKTFASSSRMALSSRSQPSSTPGLAHARPLRPRARAAIQAMVSRQHRYAEACAARARHAAACHRAEFVKLRWGRTGPQTLRRLQGSLLLCVCALMCRQAPWYPGGSSPHQDPLDPSHTCPATPAQEVQG